MLLTSEKKTFFSSYMTWIGLMLMLGIAKNLSHFLLSTPPPHLCSLNVEQNGLNFKQLRPKLLLVSDCVDETFISTL